MEARELLAPVEAGRVGNETVETVAAPQEVELPGRLAVDTPEGRHQEGEEGGGPGVLQLFSTGRAGGGGRGGGGGGGFLQV